MDITIKPIETGESCPKWDSYVNCHPRATLYHLSNWKGVIGNTCGHKAYYLMAIKNYSPSAIKTLQPKIGTNLSPDLLHINDNFQRSSDLKHEQNNFAIVGILPLMHLKHFLFGNSLISIPFFDIGGILADEEETEKALLQEAVVLGRKLNVDNIELRHALPLTWFNSDPKQSTNPISYETKTHKVRMLLDLPASSEILMKSFNSKLRSQIKKPMKEGLISKIGGVDLISDFYKVFTINMRDLGSPVHSKKLIQSVFEGFPQRAKIVMVYFEGEPVAGSVIIGYNDTVENPWASALRKYSRLSPNMLLYWSMLEYACDNGYARFDFGRSSPGEGTCKFKEQWGAKPQALNWHYISFGKNDITAAVSQKPAYERVSEIWKKMPLSLTKIIGPKIRKYIAL
jgi:serine/alanine adding enzyme